MAGIKEGGIIRLLSKKKVSARGLLGERGKGTHEDANRSMEGRKVGCYAEGPRPEAHSHEKENLGSTRSPEEKTTTRFVDSPA